MSGLSRMLWRIRETRERIREIDDMMEALRDGMERITPRYDQAGGGGAAGDRMMTFCADLEALEQRRVRLVRQELRTMQHVKERIGMLQKPASDILLHHYVEGESWRIVARRVGLSPRQCMRVRDRILGWK